MWFLVTISILWICSVQQTRAQNPCIDYTPMDEQNYKRSTGYISLPGEGYLCDRFIIDTVWYRFTGRQGGDMPLTPPTLLSCGTVFPIWMRGTLPTAQGEVVDATGCVLTTTSDCDAEYPIQVMNCGTFNVYKLTRTAGCDEAYCFGSEFPCPEGQSSATGYTPGCVEGDVPILLTDPYITPFVWDIAPGIKEVRMRCDIDHDEDDVEYDIYWYVNDESVKEHLAVAPNLMPVNIEEEHLRMDTNLKCAVFPRKKPSNLLGNPRQATYFIGVEVESRFITVKEGGDPSFYIFRPTIPILCNLRDQINFQCELDINVIAPVMNDDGSPAVCLDGVTADQISFEAQECGKQLSGTADVTRKYEIPLRATADNIYDGLQTLEIAFATPDRFVFHPIWQNYNLPTAQVNVVDEDIKVGKRYCQIYDDPHMKTFDGRKYEHQYSGEFIIFRHKSLPIEVQAYFRPCRNAATCVCGAAIRSGGDVFVYDKCRPLKPSRIRLYHCRSSGLHIKPKGNDVYVVTLPTGTRVEIHPWSIFIYPSVSDWGNTEGLCGTLTGTCFDDFVLNDDEPETVNYDPVNGCAGGAGAKYPTFSKSWRVKAGHSLYKGEEPEQVLPPEVLYCICSSDPNNDRRTVPTCSTMENEAPLPCVRRDQTDRHTGRCVSRRRRSTDQYTFYDDDVEEEVEMFDYDPEFDPPEQSWRDGWTEELAREECLRYIRNKPGTQACLAESAVDVDSAVELCVMDIFLTANTSFSIVHLDAVLTLCQEEIVKNMSYYSYQNVTSDETGNETLVLETPALILQHVCPADCNEQGTCEKGICVCLEGYTGVDCSGEKDKIPDLFELPNNGLCDQQLRPCGMTPITGDYFIESENLLCKIQTKKLLQDQTEVNVYESIIESEYDHSQRVLCPFPLLDFDPDVNVLYISYSISVSNDGERYSAAQTVTSYDSKCIECVAGQGCEQKANTCLYRNTCYTHGESVDAAMFCFICNGATGNMEKDSTTCYIGEECYLQGQQTSSEHCTCDPTETDSQLCITPGSPSVTPGSDASKISASGFCLMIITVTAALSL